MKKIFFLIILLSFCFPGFSVGFDTSKNILFEEGEDNQIVAKNSIVLGYEFGFVGIEWVTRSQLGYQLHGDFKSVYFFYPFKTKSKDVEPFLRFGYTVPDMSREHKYYNDCLSESFIDDYVNNYYQGPYYNNVSWDINNYNNNSPSEWLGCNHHSFSDGGSLLGIGVNYKKIQIVYTMHKLKVSSEAKIFVEWTDEFGICCDDHYTEAHGDAEFSLDRITFSFLF